MGTDRASYEAILSSRSRQIQADTGFERRAFNTTRLTTGSFSAAGDGRCSAAHTRCNLSIKQNWSTRFDPVALTYHRCGSDLPQLCGHSGGHHILQQKVGQRMPGSLLILADQTCSAGLKYRQTLCKDPARGVRHSRGDCWPLPGHHRQETTSSGLGNTAGRLK